MVTFTDADGTLLPFVTSSQAIVKWRPKAGRDSWSPDYSTGRTMCSRHQEPASLTCATDQQSCS